MLKTKVKYAGGKMIVFLHKVINKIKDGYIKEMFIEGKWILKYVKLYRKSVIFYILLGILGTAMSFASSVASKYLIDDPVFLKNRCYAIKLFGNIFYNFIRTIR